MNDHNDTVLISDPTNVTLLTRQAPIGRNKESGLRIGELERDALLLHPDLKEFFNKTFNGPFKLDLNIHQDNQKE